MRAVFAARCARAAIGHAAAAPPSNVMNSRRPIEAVAPIPGEGEGCGPTIAQSKGVSRGPVSFGPSRESLPWPI